MHLILLVGVKLEVGVHIQILPRCFSFSELVIFYFSYFYKASSLTPIKLLLQECITRPPTAIIY